MVQGRVKHPRHWVPVLGIIALLCMFLKLPEIPDILGAFDCKTCFSNNPYFPLITGAYFSVLLALSLLFPAFPGPLIARGGLVWASLLALTLTYLNLPQVCAICLVGHLCHIMIWVIWCMFPAFATRRRTSPLGERLFLTLFAPLIVIALFSAINLTFLIYHLKASQQDAATSLKAGDIAPNFAENAPTRIGEKKGWIINFISPNCSFCKEQLGILNGEINELMSDSYRFINITPALTPELIQQLPLAEWIEDPEGNIRQLFKVSGYPTLFVVSADSKITKVISGVPENLVTELIKNNSNKD